ncbi:HEAT repeat domain-containing protein [Polaribacter ponticola]|uniref:HEAT repeat domain-containing protein n=1 Tax=Polaribacter ponticola TaxID=2978475 RepID=A0ABT5S8P4_9FLAO|nr:HEAT repeat domain-containing protein [Polaribacter sp. MSW5]MDD7914484.1 HEAT repeat domain-containing protein [Polaribacter sp. MSW5]
MNFPLVESVIWTLVVILSIVILILIFYLKALRSNIRLTEVRKIKYRNNVEQLLIEFLYSEDVEGEKFSDNQKKIIKKFKKGVPSKNKRQIISNTFFELSREISGNMILTMHKLYEELGLLNFAIKKLRSKKWNIIAIGIKDLRQFKIKRTQNLITKFINHKREEVRREAHLYFLELFGYEGLSFLDNLKAPLSEWDQIQLLREIEKFENHEIIDVTKWLRSENKYVIILILNVVKFFNRLETKEILLELINHSSFEVRIKAIDILTHFEVAEAKEILKNKILELSLKEQIALFELLEKTATIADSVFVLDYISSNNFELKHKALKILKTVDKGLYDKLEKTSNDESYNKIINFLDFSYGI